MASTGMFAPHWDLVAPPGQGMPERWMKEPPGFRPQTSLRPFESFHKFLGPDPFPWWSRGFWVPPLFYGRPLRYLQGQGWLHIWGR